MFGSGQTIVFPVRPAEEQRALIARRSAFYPALKRLEQWGIVSCTLDETTHVRRRALYRLSSKGKRALERWLKQPIKPDDVLRRMPELKCSAPHALRSESPVPGFSRSRVRRVDVWVPWLPWVPGFPGEWVFGLPRRVDVWVPIAGAASDEARPSISSGSQQPTGANAGDVAECTRLRTVRGKARTERGVGRGASSDRGTRSGASHVRASFRGIDWRGRVSGSPDRRPGHCEGALNPISSASVQLFPCRCLYLAGPRT
jgi:Transcriptional regulator PadR-like family